VVASPLASGLACLSDEERDLGVALVEIGASVTNVALYAGGMLVGLQALPFGAADITDDIASAFSLRRSQAQRVQSYYGSASSTPRDNNEQIDVDPSIPDSADKPRVTRAQLIAVIRQRLDFMMNEIGKTLKDLGFVGPVGRQVVLTGGGADLKAIADYAQAALGRAARVGRPQGLVGLPDAHAGPAFATLAGLALYAASDPVDLRDLALSAQDVVRPQGGALLQRLAAALKNSF
jgi:cell division protein FtsA